MPSKLTQLVLLLLVLLQLKLGLRNESATVFGCKEGERKALLDFKDGLKDPGGRLSSWKGHDCCTWRGVQCDNKTGNVIHLDLGNKRFLSNMFGYGLHAQPLQGKISRALLGLEHLRYLDLSMNFFGGSKIPTFFCSLRNLVHLDLSCAGFSGPVPHELGNLSNLSYLDLSNPFYISWNNLYMVGSHWLSNLSSLGYLNLNFVDLSKSPNLLQSLNTLSSTMFEINLSTCKLHVPLSLQHVNLTNLRVLDLSGNDVNSTVPQWLFKLTSLEKLDLSFNSFQGLVPSAIGNLTSLKVLSLANNGVLQVGIPTTLGNLCMLNTLDLSGNSYISGDLSDLGETFSGCIKHSLQTFSWVSSELSGSLPHWLQNFKSLKMLNLYVNSFYGEIPEFELPSLLKLDISRNKLNGTISKNLGKSFPRLVFLDISINDFADVLTEEHFADLKHLQHLGLSSNAFKLNVGSHWVPPLGLKRILLGNCQLGPQFPLWLQKLGKILSINLSNTSISYALPDWVWNFSSNLLSINLSNNQIKGKLPSSLEHLNNLVYVDLSGNSFEGSLPQFPSKVEDLLLFSNNITGSISATLCSLKNLKVLDLSENHMTGEIPDCWNQSLHSKLFAMDLSDNYFSGTIPHTICSQSLVYLHLSNNDLSGELPLSLKKCENLVTLDLGQNNISGDIPTWIAENLLQLETLRLRSNMFTGNIPPQLGNLSSLHVIDFSDNNLSGTIPRSLGNLSAIKVARKMFDNKKVSLMVYDKLSGSYIDNMEYLYVISTKVLVSYTDSIEVNLKGRDLRYDKLLPLLIFIDLSNNELSGEIPDELTGLSYLQNLNLSGNHLVGKIPKNIGNLRWLESLDLSWNNLSGVIPTTMIMLSSLSHLNLSHNNLYGKIPYGGQLQALPDPSIYFGNYDLCGFPLDKQCENDEAPQKPTHGVSEGGYFKDENELEIIDVCLSTGLGFMFGNLFVWGVLLLHKKWRLAYFQFVNRFVG
ncbi:hypothetical protein J5N97_008715 [Dioscorea zingiberensis]|uniref:Leucine-rich repeat-containing N-terminal plant-type domain-containing protein n=1 Tax=Dioscorea zingiberensis TaxID=325984 RepID=A0A9D5HKS9_9LILI|nr:hypothetical protein J5N97_008715 [Dioscorea zingiberensis]